MKGEKEEEQWPNMTTAAGKGTIHRTHTHSLTHSPQHEKGLSVSVQRENEETMS